jgi:hypothetical protein
MSKGSGRIARLILSLIESEPDGAWLAPNNGPGPGSALAATLLKLTPR